MITIDSDFNKKITVPQGTKVTVLKSDNFGHYKVDYKIICDFKNIPKNDHLFILNYLLRL